MFLLRRKSDGKFWRNGSVKSYARDWYESQWVDTPSDCRPFESREGARACRGVKLTCPIPWNPGNEADRRAWRAWYSQKNLPARNAAFNVAYEILQVEIKVKES